MKKIRLPKNRLPRKTMTPGEAKDFISALVQEVPVNLPYNAKGKILKEVRKLFASSMDNPYELARAILGKDFISPEEIANVRKISYGDDLLQNFMETLPSEDILLWCRDNNFAVVAGTPSPMSLLEIRDLNAHLFYSKSGGWYAENKEKFSREDKVNAEWLMFRKTTIPNSTNKTWSEQQKLLSGLEYVPNVSEMSWCLTTYKEVRDIYLLTDAYARTSSLALDGSRVGVGCFGSGGLRVDDFWDDDHDDLLVLSSARKS